MFGRMNKMVVVVSALLEQVGGTQKVSVAVMYRITFRYRGEQQ